MADYFLSIPYRSVVGGEAFTDTVTTATSTTSASYLELRWTTGVGVTKKDIFKFLMLMEKVIHENGVDRVGTGVPPT